MFGTLPRLSPGISDEAALYHAKDIKKLKRELRSFHDKFPQIFFHIVTTRLNVGASLTAYAFWIFNKAGICNQLEKGGDNRNVLLMIDAVNARAVLIVGYGLEPFISEKQLNDSVAAGAPDFAEGYYFDGTRGVIHELGRTLTRISGALDVTYGIRMSDLYPGETAGRKGAASSSGDTPY